jgi:hypothetical protein
MVGWVDVAIPGLIGLVFAVRPQAMFRASGEPSVDATRFRRMRHAGFALIAVAVGYVLIKIVEYYAA